MSGAAVSSARGRLATGVLAVFTVAAALGVGASLPLAPTTALAALTAGLAVVATVLTPRRGAVWVGAAVVAAALGMARGAAAVHHPGPGTVDGHLGHMPVVVTGTVRDGVAPGPAGGLVVEASRIGDADGEQPVDGALLVPQRTPTASPGDAVTVTAAGLRPPAHRPGPRSAAALERLGVDAMAVSATVTQTARGGPSLGGVVRAVRAGLSSSVDGSLPEPAATLLLGIAFGLRRPVEAGLTTALQDSGLFHIVVVSGLKVIIVAGMIRAVADIRGWSRRRHAVVAVASVGGYVLLSGAGVAAVRSAVMAGVALGLGRGGRRADPLPVLALVAAVTVTIDPHVWSDVGFQLSFLGTAGILLLAGRIGDRLPGPRLLAEPFAVTVAAQLATLPVMAGTFGVVSLVGPLANAVALPLLPSVIVVGSVGAVVGILAAPVGWLPLHLGMAGVDAIVIIARLAAAIPGGAVHVGEWPASWTVAELAGLAGALAVALPEVLRRRRHARDQPAGRGRDGRGWARARLTGAAAASGLLSAAGVLLIAGRPDGRLRVTVLDTGAATAVLVRTGGGGLGLVDGGADPAVLVTALGRVLPPLTRSLDMVVMTGGDRTSIGGLAGLSGRYRVQRVMAPAELGSGGVAVLDALQREGATVEPLGGGGWAWGDAAWRCLTLGATRQPAPACALRVAAADGSLLVLGGASLPDQEQLAALPGPELRVDLLVSAPGAPPAPALVAAARPSQVAEPSGRAARAPPEGERLDLTGVEGDLSYTGSARGLARA